MAGGCAEGFLAFRLVRQKHLPGPSVILANTWHTCLAGGQRQTQHIVSGLAASTVRSSLLISHCCQSCVSLQPHQRQRLDHQQPSTSSASNNSSALSLTSRKCPFSSVEPPWNTPKPMYASCHSALTCPPSVHNMLPALLRPGTQHCLPPAQHAPARHTKHRNVHVKLEPPACHHLSP